MLIQLNVKNLAIVTELELNFAHGMQVITGETGAGKSIIIDALSLVLGERASPDQIRAGEAQAEVTACFKINQLPAVLEILKAQELHVEDDCIIRRIINSDGRSRAYLNGHSVTAQQLKSIAPLLVQIHSQHQHHALLESDYQRQILDVYAGHDQLLNTVAAHYQEWQSIRQQIQILNESQNQSDKLTLLNYQIQEFENLNLQPDELVKLDQQHKTLAKSEELLAISQNVLALLEDEGSGITQQLHNALQQVNALQKIAPQFKSCAELLQQATISISETSNEVNNFLAKLDLDPTQLQVIEQRLGAIHNLARKLKVAPEFLTEHFQHLCAERNSLNNVNERLEQLQASLVACELKYQHAAQQLTASRKQFALQLDKEIIARLKLLEMPNALFEIALEPLKHAQPSLYGNETINFLVTTNPGQPTGLLKKIASGGELSRISLAIQVISAQRMATPTLILDEVDVGISGKTAATVGQLMRELSANAQILCITHLPQVASLAHAHYKVEKHQTAKQTSTQITLLDAAQRVQELARLLGGINITPEALAHAKRMLTETV